ncbi:ribosomal pre-60S maturation factor [Metschnikowia bicuspidata var. bicuspidata NRRL YB-4993]|uniref:Ribosomal pre-60S maturation factor n=1 Tax=Metschnikowia bicuspidata var. bicuspidata NRRL YB-4993 TaxID=869754 RepID=A0A1A0HD35_9ASCO|nr:ribosomal pre-60S maturation factor [Metschnikowia bicuspidata var. bicuspidata NRRL YB-4993]OBA21989.1 ribosomal pre-60S maturation factor [Metschnikowia bicuspidata var. bicuspidata NRRL YB-4993]
MPSRNSVNKPLGKINRASHAGVISKKRTLRANTVGPTRSSAGRYNTATAPRPTDPKGLTVYMGPEVLGSGVTTQTLLKKKAKKLERNKRYIAQRNERLNVDLAAKNEGMDVDMAPAEKREKKQKPQSNLDKVKQALWTAVEDHNSGAMALESTGEGTTLGVQAF